MGSGAGDEGAEARAELCEWVLGRGKRAGVEVAFGEPLGEEVGSANSRMTREPRRDSYVLWRERLSRWLAGGAEEEEVASGEISLLDMRWELYGRRGELGLVGTVLIGTEGRTSGVAGSGRH